MSEEHTVMGVAFTSPDVHCDYEDPCSLQLCGIDGLVFRQVRKVSQSYIMQFKGREAAIMLDWV